MSSEIKMLQHLKLEKGSILVISGDINCNTMERFREALEFMGLDFKIPIIGLSDDAKITLAKRDEIITQLDQLIDKETIIEEVK